MKVTHLLGAAVFIAATAAVPASSLAQIVSTGIPVPQTGIGTTVPVSGTSRGLTDRQGQRSLLTSARDRGKASPTGSIGLKTDKLSEHGHESSESADTISTASSPQSKSHHSKHHHSSYAGTTP
jgi:hypothetical protein